MANYSFLFDKAKEQDFVERCAAACLVLVDAIINGGNPTDPEKAWVKSTISDPLRAGRDVASIVVGSENASDEAAINSLTDAQIQTIVDTAKAVLTSG